KDKVRSTKYEVRSTNGEVRNVADSSTSHAAPQYFVLLTSYFVLTVYFVLTKSPLGGNFDAFRIAPQAFEAVELAGGGCEDVHDEIEVVDEHPVAAVLAFHDRRLGALPAQGVLDGLRNGLHLAGVGART